MAIAEVGAAVTFDSATANISSAGKSVAMTPTAGNALVVITYLRGSTSSACPVTATGGTATFTSQVAQLGNSTYLHISTATNIGSGITAIVVTPNVSARGQIYIQEYSGVDTTTPIDVTSAASALSTATTITPPSLTPVTNGALCINAFGSQQNTGSGSPGAYTTGGPTSHSGTKAGLGWSSERDYAAGTGATTHNLVVGSNLVNDISGAYQADWTIASTFACLAGAVMLRPAVPTPAGNTTNFFAMM